METMYSEQQGSTVRCLWSCQEDETVRVRSGKSDQKMSNKGMSTRCMSDEDIRATEILATVV